MKEKTRKAIKYLEEEGYEIKNNELIKIPELNMEVKFEKWTESYNELLKNIPKGFRLMKCSEFFKIEESGLLDKITKETGIYIHLEQLPIDKENKRARVLYRVRDSILVAWDEVLANTIDSGRVIFVREKLK